ncbi:MAG: hypothetical protein FDZ70_04180 [Actinobacteria bacterium]|nr:MAG: hypothetical protein FDZ70_04180 [Actinomycetota bacterium]
MKRSVSPLILFVIGAACTLGLAIWSVFGIGTDEAGLEMVASIGAVGIAAVCSATVLLIALSFPKAEPWRRQWLLVGLGIGAFALGNLARAGETAWGLDPILTDVGLIAEYFLLGAALVAVGQAYVPMVDWRRPGFGAAGTGAAFLAVLWFGVIQPFVLPDAESVSAMVRTVAYPVADILLLVVPATFVSLCLAQIGGDRFARPWWAVTFGVGVLALSQGAIIVLQAMPGAYYRGMFVDYGPVLSQVLVAMGALSAAALAVEFMWRPESAPVAESEPVSEPAG